ncbi:HFL263Wp [Eremothecium sinecaudum]|uniref:HFL263Wp n=1 Tax=Eremothecium sinecaudum TaxID=45286 RepID=A0A0X8HUD3_9SACH|nr:HFL263Wp [Eremothecium sinecaudum]AMD21593.1 HFL263Wp [Eremothecium sinecaudum]
MQSPYSPTNLYSGFNYYWFDSEIDFANQDLELRVLTNPYDNVTPQLDLDTALVKLNSPKKDFETVLIEKKLNFIWKITKRMDKLVRFDTSEARRVLKEWYSENETELEATSSVSIDELTEVPDVFNYDSLEEIISFTGEECPDSGDFNIISLARGQFGIEGRYQMYDDEKQKCIGIVARTIGLDEVALRRSNRIPGWPGFKRVGHVATPPAFENDDSFGSKTAELITSEKGSESSGSVFSAVKRLSLDGGTFTDARYQPIEFIPSVPGPRKIEKYDEPDIHPSVPTFCDSDYKMLRRSLYEPRLCYYSLHGGVHFVTPRFLPGHQNPSKRNHDYFLIAIDNNKYEHLTPTQKCLALFSLWRTSRHYFEINSVPVETLIGHENSLAQVTKLYGTLKDAVKHTKPSQKVKHEIQSVHRSQPKRHGNITSIMHKLFKTNKSRALNVNAP